MCRLTVRTVALCLILACFAGPLVGGRSNGAVPRGHVPVRRHAPPRRPALRPPAGHGGAPASGQGRRARRRLEALRPVRRRLVYPRRHHARAVPNEDRGGRRGPSLRAWPSIAFTSTRPPRLTAAPRSCSRSRRTRPPFRNLKSLDEITNRLAEAVKRSLDGLQPFDTVGLGQAKVDRVAAIRRVITPEGKLLTRWSACRDPELAAMPEGGIDPILRTITLAQGNKPLVRMHYYGHAPADLLPRGPGQLRLPRHGPAEARRGGGRVSDLLHGLLGRRDRRQVQPGHAGVPRRVGRTALRRHEGLDRRHAPGARRPHRVAHDARAVHRQDRRRPRTPTPTGPPSKTPRPSPTTASPPPPVSPASSGCASRSTSACCGSGRRGSSTCRASR